MKKSKIEPSDHFDGRYFFNPNGLCRQKTREWLRWMLKEPKALWPKNVTNSHQPQLVKRFTGRDPLVTFVLHACFLIQWEGLNLLIDPVYSRRCSPIPFIGPARVRKPGVSFEDLPPIDLVLISHNHYDHLDAKTIRRLQDVHAPKFVCPLGDRRLLKKLGAKKIIELDWWQSADLRIPLKITFTQAQHWSGRGWYDHMKSLWGGYFIESQSSSVFFAGDTGYGPHFKKIRECLGAPDLSLLPVGAYAPRWFMREHHMDPADSVRAHIDLNSALSVGMHFGSFQLANEAFDAHAIELAQARLLHGVHEDDFRLLGFGETLDLKIQKTAKVAAQMSPLYQSV